MTKDNVGVNIQSIPQDAKQAVNLEDLAMKTQPTSHKVYTSTPPVRELQNGQMVLYNDGTNGRLYVKIGDSLYYITLTKV